MSSIDLVILGMVQEKPQSAYALQKDVADHHFGRWTRISSPSIYKKVLQLRNAGYLSSETIPGDRFAEKAVYSITEKGQAHFRDLMEQLAGQEVPLLFDCNVLLTNLNKLPLEEAMRLLEKLRNSIAASLQTVSDTAAAYPDLPLAGKAIFTQQRCLYAALLQWLDDFAVQYREEASHDLPKQSDHSV